MYIYKPIGKLSDVNEKTSSKVIDNNEKLLDINASALSNSIVIMINENLHKGEGKVNKTESIYVRQGLIDKLTMASFFLPQGYKFALFGAWEDTSDSNESSQAMTGGSIDISIIDVEGKLLEMGTDIYMDDEKSETRYYEDLMPKGIMLTNDENRYINNRRFLYNVLTRSGFVVCKSKWWSFDYGTSYWANVKSKDAIYSDIENDLC